jgi:hypothetical protein
MSMALFLSDGAEGVPCGAAGRRVETGDSAEGAGWPLLQAVMAAASAVAAAR